MSGSPQRDLLRRLQPIAKVLPRRLKPAQRAALLSQLERHIQRWVEINPEIEPYQRKLKRLTIEADNLIARLKKTEQAVLDLGVDTAKLMPSNLYQLDAASDLYVVVARALDEINRWNRLWKPPLKGRPRSFAVALTQMLEEEYLRHCGSVRGFQQMLKALQEHQHLFNLPLSAPKLPMLTLSAIEKRKQRK